MLNVREDHIRISLATYQFTGEAYQWWLFVEEQKDIALMTWKEFRKIFLAEFFPLAARQAKVELFALLRTATSYYSTRQSLQLCHVSRRVWWLTRR